MRFWKFISASACIALILFAASLTLRSVAAQTTEATPPASPPLTLLWQTDFSPDTALLSPGDIAIDSEGSVYVSNQSGSNGIKKFDSEGKLVLQWGSNGKGEGQFRLPLGVAVDAENNVFVTDFNNMRIEKFDSAGTFLQQWPTEPSNSPAFIGIDQWGNVYIDKFPLRTDNYLEKFDSSGALVTQWGSTGSGNGEFGGRLEDIAVDADGNIYVAEPLAHIVHKLDTNGKFVAEFGGEGSKDGMGLFDDPFGVAVDADGNVYVLDSHFLQKLDWEGNFITQWSTAGGDLDRATNVQVDADGNIYVFARADVKAVNGKTVKVLVLKKFQQSWTS